MLFFSWKGHLLSRRRAYSLNCRHCAHSSLLLGLWCFLQYRLIMCVIVFLSRFIRLCSGLGGWGFMFYILSQRSGLILIRICPNLYGISNYQVLMCLLVGVRGW